MKDGWVQQVGEPLELYNRPANRFVAGFIGSPGMNFATVSVTGSDGALWVGSDGIRVKVPAELCGRLAPYAGRQVTLGIRPEDLRIGSGSDPAELCLDALVEVVEQLGSEILLDVAVGSTTMVAAVEPTVRARIGDKLRLALNPARLHFFDQVSEAAV
jgi:multiple sugar transport system ATP-binding protein